MLEGRVLLRRGRGRGRACCAATINGRDLLDITSPSFFLPISPFFSILLRSKAASLLGDQNDDDTRGVKIPIYKLYRYADNIDRLLISCGLVCCTAVGLVWPAFYVMMGSVSVNPLPDRSVACPNLHIVSPLYLWAPCQSILCLIAA